MTWIGQLVEHSYVQRETRGSTPDSGLYFPAIDIARQYRTCMLMRKVVHHTS